MPVVAAGSIAVAALMGGDEWRRMYNVCPVGQSTALQAAAVVQCQGLQLAAWTSSAALLVLSHRTESQPRLHHYSSAEASFTGNLQ